MTTGRPGLGQCACGPSHHLDTLVAAETAFKGAVRDLQAAAVDHGRHGPDPDRRGNAERRRRFEDQIRSIRAELKWHRRGDCAPSPLLTWRNPAWEREAAARRAG